MASLYSGNFSAKHPQGTMVDPSIMDRVAADIVNGCIACKIAHAIAAELNIAPSLVGIAIDLQNVRIKACQLGLFGYGKEKKIVSGQETEVDAELEAAIRNKLDDGRLSCADAWHIAGDIGIARLEIGRACEALKIKINQCQIGAF